MVDLALQKGSNAERSRHANRQAVLAQVRLAGTVGRAEIARALSLSTQTVSNIIAELSNEGMLLDKGRLSAGRGLPAIQYALNPQGGYALGIEVRPDAVFIALLDMRGCAVFTERAALLQTDPAFVLDQAKAMYLAALEHVPQARGRILGLGIVMPGPFGVTGIVGSESDLTGWQERDAAAAFQEAIGLPVMLSNDANAAAIAERLNGVAQDIATFAYLYFGAGLGLGLIHQGQLVAGAFGNAGEVGHIPIGPIGREDPDGQPGASGTLERALSRLSVQRHMHAAGKPADSIEALDILFAQNDPDLRTWLETACGALGHAMAIIENLYDPQTVVLGGAMPDAILDYLVANSPLPDLSVSNRPEKGTPRLMRGTSGRMTATLGAGVMILNRALGAPLSHTS